MLSHKNLKIIHLYKRNGNPEVCDDNRDISVLSIVGNVLAKILLKRLNVHLDQKGTIPKSQCGFRKDRANRPDLHSKTALGEIRRIACRSIHKVDLPKTFDKVGRDGLWRFIAMVRQFHDGM